MNIFNLNRINFSDEFCNSLFDGKTDSNYYNSLSDSGKRNYKHLLTFIEVENAKAYVSIKSKSASLRNRRVELVKPSDRDKVLNELYKNIETTRNGRDSFYIKVLNFYANISRRYVQQFLEKQENYQLHLLQTKEKVLRPSGDTHINSRWAIDLIDMQNYKSPQNNQRAWLLTCIDVFSKYAFVRAITKKEALKVAEALDSILQENYSKTGEYPRLIQSDNGLEFKNKEVSKIFKEKEIKHIFSIPYWPQSNGAIERFNRTLKSAIFAYFTRSNSTKYFEVLDQIVENYNNTVHSTIKSTPANVHNANRANTKQIKLVEEHKKEWISSTRNYKPLHRGDFVRTHILTNKEDRKNKTFAKKFVPQWSRQIYKVIGIRGARTDPDKLKTKLTYKLQQIFEQIPKTSNYFRVNGPVLFQGFYRHDLQKIPLSFINKESGNIVAKPVPVAKPKVSKVLTSTIATTKPKRITKPPSRYGN